VKVLFIALIFFLQPWTASCQTLVLPGKHCSLADVVEPLIPAVVNISTTHYNPAKGHEEDVTDPGDMFFEWFERRFLRPFDSPDRVERRGESLGSGFLISKDGYIVTNNHVIEGAHRIKVKIGGLERHALQAKVIGSDKITDLAVLKVDSKQDLPFVEFGDSNVIRVGDPVVVIGNPFGLGGTVTCGIVSSKAREIDIEGSLIGGGVIQTDAAINKGNSGGPMFNLQGKVIGVNFALISASPSGENVGIGFAIPSNHASAIVKQLIQSGRIGRGALNITIKDISEELAKDIGYKDLAGVLVESVVPGGSGASAGLKAGDVIVKFMDKEVTSARKLRALVAGCPVNTIAKITVLRNGGRKDLFAKIVDEEASISKDIAALNAIEINEVIFANIDSAAKQNLGVDEGVLIKRVGSHSDWRSFLNKGDVIIAAVGVGSIENVVKLKKIYTEARAKQRKWLVLLVRRNKLNVSIRLPVL
jgi:serine protease Do